VKSALWLVGLAAIACSHDTNEVAQAKKIVPPSVSAQVALPTATAEPERDNGTIAAASSFVDDELYACSELYIDVPQAVVAALATKSDAGLQFIFDDDLSLWLRGGKTITTDLITAQRGKEASSGLRPKGAAQVLKKPCRDQFSRQLIASCTTALKPTSAPIPISKVALQTLYYQIPGDQVMARCMAAGSDWWEVPQDSAEYIRANARDAMRRLRKQTGQ
jgi:hypothetical protein